MGLDLLDYRLHYFQILFLFCPNGIVHLCKVSSGTEGISLKPMDSWFRQLVSCSSEIFYIYNRSESDSDICSPFVSAATASTFTVGVCTKLLELVLLSIPYFPCGYMDIVDQPVF